MPRPVGKPSPGFAHPRELILEQIEARTLELPILSETASQIMVACRDENAGPLQIAGLMERDPTLAGHVLRLANSAAYSPGQPIVSLTQAVSQLGFSAISEITMTVALHGRVFDAPRFTADIRSVWSHAAVAGGWARQIARRRRANVEGAFLCGLLHDMGRPVIFQAVTDYERHIGLPFSDQDVRSACDEFHPQVGAALIQHWALPEWMGDAIAWHHQPESAPRHRDQVLCAALSEELASWSLAGSPTEEKLASLPMVAGLHFYPEDFDALLGARDDVVTLTRLFC